MFFDHYLTMGPELRTTLSRTSPIRPADALKELVAPEDNFRIQIRAREIAAIVANGRWIYSSALDRKESRGMAKREDFPNLDPNSYHHTLTGGLDEVWVKRTPALGGLSDAGKPLVAGSEIEKQFTVAALFVHPNQTPLTPDEDLLADNLGKYRAQIGWGKGGKLGARTAVGPRMG